MSTPFQVRPWLAEDVRHDTSWIIRMTAEEVAGFDAALAHAQGTGKGLLEMNQEDFPLPDASRAVLKRAIDTTQERWGMCLLKGFPVQRWTEAQTRLAYWGMGLYMGVGRTQNRASEIINDVRDAGGNYKIKGGAATTPMPAWISTRTPATWSRCCAVAPPRAGAPAR